MTTPLTIDQYEAEATYLQSAQELEARIAANQLEYGRRLRAERAEQLQARHYLTSILEAERLAKKQAMHARQNANRANRAAENQRIRASRSGASGRAK